MCQVRHGTREAVPHGSRVLGCGESRDEKRHMPEVELEMWIKVPQSGSASMIHGDMKPWQVQESLAMRNIKPVSADRQWIEECSGAELKQVCFGPSASGRTASRSAKTKQPGCRASLPQCSWHFMEACGIFAPQIQKKLAEERQREEEAK